MVEVLKDMTLQDILRVKDNLPLGNVEVEQWFRSFAEKYPDTTVLEPEDEIPMPGPLRQRFEMRWTPATYVLELQTEDNCDGISTMFEEVYPTKESRDALIAKMVRNELKTIRIVLGTQKRVFRLYLHVCPQIPEGYIKLVHDVYAHRMSEYGLEMLYECSMDTMLQINRKYFANDVVQSIN
jgi:hypothetical protein